LRKLNLRNADLRGAKLSQCKLKDTYLENSDLRGADLSKIKTPAIIARNLLKGAKYDLHTWWPSGFDPSRFGAQFVGEGETLHMYQPKIFLSYAWADEKLVMAIDQWLRNKGLDTKIDKRDFFAGQRIRDAILEAMAACDAVVIFYSDASKDKPWPEFERDLASDLQIEARKDGKTPPRVIYVVLGDLNLPSITERNRIAVMTKGKKFPLVCDEIYRGIVGLAREPQLVNLDRWMDHTF
jgi:hypothetical protein